MANYEAAVIPAEDIKDMLDTSWDNKENVLPEPTFYVVNSDDDPVLRVDLRKADAILIRADSVSEEEIPIGNWTYGNRRTRITLEVHTMKTRQRLYDLRNEIRRIAHEQMHSLTNWQRIQYATFNEYTQTQINVWAGQITLELVNNAVLLET